MKRTLSIAAAAVLGLGLTVAASSASAVERVEVCHATGNGEYMPIEVAPAALDAHYAHGDKLTCDEEPPVVNVLARAYIDRGAGGDVLIAEWRDDGTVVASEYPLGFAGAPTGVFGVANVAVVSTLQATSEVCSVQTADGVLTWTRGSQSESFVDGATQFVDYFAPVAEDVISADTGSSLQPDTAVSLTQEGPDDDAFLTVELNCAP